MHLSGDPLYSDWTRFGGLWTNAHDVRLSLLAQRLIGERPFTPVQWVSFALSLSGLGYIFLKGLQLESHGVYGIILMLIAVFSFSYSGVMVKTGRSRSPLPHTVARASLVPFHCSCWPGGCWIAPYRWLILATTRPGPSCIWRFLVH